jgi:hypothetical protein
MFKMGSHDPLGFLKHKLWPKEKLRIKLTKSQESPWFPCVQVVCHIPLESVFWGLQLCLRPHLNQRFAHKVGPPKLHESQFWEFQDSNLGVLRQNDIWVLAPWPDTKEYYKGEGGGFPQVRAVMSLVNQCLPMACPCTKSVPTMH